MVFAYAFLPFQVGKALFDGQLLDVHFTRSFYKHILGAKVTYHDIEAIDPDYFKNLKWMLEVGYVQLFPTPPHPPPPLLSLCMFLVFHLSKKENVLVFL